MQLPENILEMESQPEIPTEMSQEKMPEMESQSEKPSELSQKKVLEMGSQPEKPVVARQTRKRIVITRRRFSIIKCLAKVEMVLGCGIFFIGLLINFLIFFCIGYCSDKISGHHDEGNEFPERENFTKIHLIMIKNSTEQEMMPHDLPVECEKVDATTFTAMLVSTYLISLYGLTLFWTNYRMVHGLHPKNYYPFLTKWLMVKASLLIAILILLEFFSGMEAPITGIYLAITLYCLYGLLLMLGLYKKLDSYVQVKEINTKPSHPRDTARSKSAFNTGSDYKCIRLPSLSPDNPELKITCGKMIKPSPNKDYFEETLHIKAHFVDCACKKNEYQKNASIDIVP